MKTAVFRHSVDDYHRDTKVLASYVEQVSLYLSKQKNISIEKAKEFVVKNLRAGGEFEFKDPRVKFLHREDFADRVEKTTTLSKYLADVSNNNESLAPTFTSYCSPDVEESLLAVYTEENIAIRDVLKGEMFEAQNAGDEVLYVFKNLGQNNVKLTNNSLSGASLTPSTALYNPTSHSTLTTNCRNTTAQANSNNEKFIEGNRHYYCVDVILNNLVSICHITDLNKVQIAMSDYGLYYPTKEDVIDCIEYSRVLYFTSKKHMQPVYDFIDTMNTLERAAFVYVSDFYHLHKHNKEFVESFLKESVRIPTETLDLDFAQLVIKTLPSDTTNLARLHCHHFSKGKTPKDMLKDSPDDYCKLAAVAKHINDVLVDKQSLIDAFWLTDNMPASTGLFPTSLRRSVLGGDTDSTLFSAQGWVERMYGHVHFSDEANAISNTVIYLAAQTVSHLHAKMSANYGMHKSKLFDTVMKNEYRFDTFMVTNMAKHYAALQTAQEGNVYTKPGLELKGANLISSATPGSIVKEVKDLLLDMKKKISNNEKISLNDILDDISNKENEIYNQIKSGDTTYFRSSYIKEAGAYKDKNPDRTPYWNHLFWTRTFGKIYGEVDNPPYVAIKVSLEINTVTEWRDWLEKISNKQLVQDIMEETDRIGRRFMTTMYVPLTIVQVSGIPDEILMASNARKIVRECCGAYYHLLETMGVSMSNSKNTRMVYDTY